MLTQQYIVNETCSTLITNVNETYISVFAVLGRGQRETMLGGASPGATLTGTAMLPRSLLALTWRNCGHHLSVCQADNTANAARLITDCILIYKLYNGHISSVFEMYTMIYIQCIVPTVLNS